MMEKRFTRCRSEISRDIHLKIGPGTDRIICLRQGRHRGHIVRRVRKTSETFKSKFLRRSSILRLKETTRTYASRIVLSFDFVSVFLDAFVDSFHNLFPDFVRHCCFNVFESFFMVDFAIRCKLK